jgi:serine protease Do
LIDLDGKVIGINTAISSNSGAFQGVGFAIPVSRAIWVKDELLERGRVRRARMGLQLGSIPTDVRRQLDVLGGGGALVVSVAKGRAADRAGLLMGDVIIRFDDQRVADEAELADMIEISPVNEPIELVVIRAGERMQLKVSLDEMK